MIFEKANVQMESDDTSEHQQPQRQHHVQETRLQQQQAAGSEEEQMWKLQGDEGTYEEVKCKGRAMATGSSSSSSSSSRNGNSSQQSRLQRQQQDKVRPLSACEHRLEYEQQQQQAPEHHIARLMSYCCTRSLAPDFLYDDRLQSVKCTSERA